MPEFETDNPTPEPKAKVAPNPAPAPTPEHFPMGLEEYAVTVRLDPLWAAGLAAYAGRDERLQTEWNTLLAEFKERPVQNS